MPAEIPMPIDWDKPGSVRLLCPKGLAVFARREIDRRKITASDETTITLSASLREAVAWNLTLRIPHRILFEVAQCTARTPDQLYHEIKRIEWERMIPSNGHLTVDGFVRTPSIRDHRFALLKTKDAVVDRLRDTTGERPDAGPARPDSSSVFLHWEDHRCTLSLDTSGESLSHRGFRLDTGPAPLRESLAAACLMAADWKPETPLVVPFCGVGTLAIEAARIASGQSPRSADRPYAFRALRGWQTDMELTHTASTGAVEGQASSMNSSILACDIDSRCLALGGPARAAAEKARVADMITWQVADVRDLPTGTTPSVWVMNPPYGQRLEYGQDQALTNLYQAIGNKIRSLPKGSRAVVITDRSEWLDAIGGKTARQYPVYNGPIRCRIAVWDIA